MSLLFYLFLSLSISLSLSLSLSLCVCASLAPFSFSLSLSLCVCFPLYSIPSISVCLSRFRFLYAEYINCPNWLIKKTSWAFKTPQETGNQTSKILTNSYKQTAMEKPNYCAPPPQFLSFPHRLSFIIAPDLRFHCHYPKIAIKVS